MTKELQKLQSSIAACYNLDELRTLCFQMAVDFDELGEGGKSAKIRGFLVALGKQGRYDELLKVLHTERTALFLETDLSLDINFQKKLYASLSGFETSSRYSQPRSKDEQILLGRVKSFWVEGVLANSLHDSLLINVGKNYKPEAVHYPWESELQTPARSREANLSVDKDKHIDDIFDEAENSLLILGQPGSGKTTMLLELARQLVLRAERDPSLPIPVVFHLSSWHGNKSIVAWIVDELKEKYRIPKNVGRTKINDNRLTLMLDGLDEVKLDRQIRCIEAINSFIINHGLVQLAICSRLSPYENAYIKLRLQNSIDLKPLESTEIEAYFSSGGLALNSVHTVLKKDKVLQELARTPLFLNIMTLTYQDESVEILTGADKEQQRNHLFESYVLSMLTRRGKIQNYSIQQIIDYLVWLANQMNNRGLTIFSIEQLQPSWISSRTRMWIYTFFTRMLCGLLLGVVLLVFNWGTDKWVIFEGLIAGLVVGFFDGIGFDIQRDRPESTLEKNRGFVKSFVISILRITLIGTSVGFLTGIISAIITGDIMEGIVDAFFNGLVFGIIFGPRGSNRTIINDIHTVELLVWSWKSAAKGFIRGWVISFILGFPLGMFISFVAGIIVGIGSLGLGEFVVGLFRFGISVGWVTSLIFGFVGGLIGCFIGGLNAKVVEVKFRPNEGIRLSMRNAIVSGTTVGLGFGISFFIFGWIVANLLGYFNITSGPGDWGITTILPIGLWIWLTIGLVVAFLYGGFDIVQHFILRVILSRQKHIPLKLPVFLDEMVNRIILRRVGGSYIFMHRMLMEYFVSNHPTYHKERRE